MTVYYVDRKTGKVMEEVVAGNTFLKWIYDTKSGYFLLEALLKRKLFSFLYGKIQDFSISKYQIKRFVEDLKIDMSEAQLPDIFSYKTFNDFFIRKLKIDARPINDKKDILISPADGRIVAYENINIYELLQIKGCYYSLVDLFQNKDLALEYNGGICLVIRLCPSDYHRFHFPDDGITAISKKIKGSYYSVNPIVLKKIKKVYCQNKREYTLFQSDNFDSIAFIEVGATCVGSIVQTYVPNQYFKKGQEKGYFKFGGSTIIMLLKKDTVKIDNDIIINAEKGIETKVNMGERIGIK